jgi:hypothetical protein
MQSDAFQDARWHCITSGRGIPGLVRAASAMTSPDGQRKATSSRDLAFYGRGWLPSECLDRRVAERSSTATVPPVPPQRPLSANVSANELVSSGRQTGVPDGVSKRRLMHETAPLGTIPDRSSGSRRGNRVGEGGEWRQPRLATQFATGFAGRTWDGEGGTRC